MFSESSTIEVVFVTYFPLNYNLSTILLLSRCIIFFGGKGVYKCSIYSVFSILFSDYLNFNAITILKYRRLNVNVTALKV